MSFLIVKNSNESGTVSRWYACRNVSDAMTPQERAEITPEEKRLLKFFDTPARWGFTCQRSMAAQFETRAEAERVKEKKLTGVGWRVIRASSKTRKK